MLIFEDDESDQRRLFQSSLSSVGADEGAAVRWLRMVGSEAVQSAAAAGLRLGRPAVAGTVGLQRSLRLAVGSAVVYLVELVEVFQVQQNVNKRL